jgi:hypothetical protein
MRYIKTFEQFINEKYNIFENKFDKESINYLEKWTKNNNNNVDDFDGSKGIKTAIKEVYWLYKNDFHVIGDIKWEQNNPDKLKTSKWTGTKWEDTDDEPSSYITASEKYVSIIEERSKACLKLLDVIQSGKHSLAESLFNNIKKYMKDVNKINKEWNKSRKEATLAPNSPEGHEEQKKFRFSYDEKAKKLFLDKIKDPKIKKDLE